MVASVVEEEPLGLDEVMNIIDEASQVLAYSRQLEHKSRELEAATNELRGANQRLQDLDRLKDDFISTVTHELRTPLTSIRAFSEILQRQSQPREAQRAKFLGIIIKESERLTRLINQVLDLAKIRSATSSPTRCPRLNGACATGTRRTAAGIRRTSCRGSIEAVLGGGGRCSTCSITFR